MKEIHHTALKTFAFLTLLSLGAATMAAAVVNHNHHDGKALIRDKSDGRHEIAQKGKYHTSLDMKNGKVAALHVRHETKGDIPVKKYKTHRKMAQAAAMHFVYASFRVAQNTDLGTEYIGYAYVDDEGNEEIYWFPYDVILDGDTGAVEYVPE